MAYVVARIAGTQEAPTRLGVLERRGAKLGYGRSGLMASLTLNFAQRHYLMGGVGLQPTHRAFSDLITFTRASGGGRFNAQGQYEWLPENEPRIDYDPVTGECRGLLIEEARTNLLTYSSDFGNAAWVTGKTAGASITANTSVAIDGSLTADTVAFAGTGDYFYRGFINYAVAAGAALTLSLFAKTQTRLIYFGGASPSGTDSFYAVDIGGGWYRQILTRTFTETTSAKTLQVLLAGTASGAGGFIIWGAQLEAGAFPTSYIPTTTAQVTRAADIASVNELSPWYNASEGTLFVDVVPMALAGGTLFSLDGGTVANQIWSSPNTGINGAYMYAAGAMQVQITGGTAASGAALKHALSFRQNDCAFVVNGVVIGSDTSFITPTVSKLNIGARWNSTGRFNGHIRSIRYWPRRLSNTELQEITA